MIYAFRDYELDLQLGELRHANTVCSIEPQAFAMLAYLLTHRDHVVTKEELLAEVWHGTPLSDYVLSTCLARVRKAVGDSGRAEQVIKTKKRQGYLFVALVEERSSDRNEFFPQPLQRLQSARLGFPATLPPISNVPHARNSNFTGRESLLAALRAALTTGHRSALTQALSGLGGVGKTQLAVEYAYRYATHYDAVWWVRAEDPTVLATDYAALAGALQLPEQATGTPTALGATVRLWLEQHPGWLLVFDNADEPATVRDYLPRSATGHVLITSRNPNWRSVASPLSVPVLERSEAVGFLLQRTGQHDEEAARALADILGRLPLALAQAGAYIEVTGITLDGYLARFTAHHHELLGRGRPSPIILPRSPRPGRWRSSRYSRRHRQGRTCYTCAPSSRLMPSLGIY